MMYGVLEKIKIWQSVIAKYDAHVCIMHNQDTTEYDKDIMETYKGIFIRKYRYSD